MDEDPPEPNGSVPMFGDPLWQSNRWTVARAGAGHVSVLLRGNPKPRSYSNEEALKLAAVLRAAASREAS